MKRRSLAATMVLAALPAFLPGASNAQTAASSKAAPVTVVIPISMNRNDRQAESLQALKRLLDVVGRQPGFIDGALMESRASGSRAAYMHVTRWQALTDWERMFANAEFQKALNANSAYFVVDAAGVYTPVR